MKRFLLIIVALLGWLMAANAQNWRTIFTADASLKRPITIKSGGKVYTLSEQQLVIDDHLYMWEAYDGNGNKIMQPSAKTSLNSNGGTSVQTYHLTTLDPAFSSSSSYGSGSYTSGGKNKEPKNKHRPVITEGATYAPGRGLNVGVQMSTFFGESLYARWDFAYSEFSLVGGIGKNLFKEEDPNVNPRKTSYFLGVGGFYGPTQDFIGIMAFGYGRRQWDGSGFLFMSMDGAYYMMGNRLALMAGASIGLSNGIKLEAHVGVTYKIINW